MSRGFHSYSRSQALHGQAAARAWRTILDTAIAHAATVRRGGAIDRFELQEFIRLGIQLQKTPFPLAHASATAGAAAFLKLATAFSVAARPEDREVLGDFMAEGARTLDRLLSLEAQRWMQRRTGERDD